MSSIDNRIVKMQLDNGQFTSAANSTMKTLSKLSESLKFKDGAKGLENITSKVKGVDMSGLSSAVDTVKERFSSLDVVAVTALVNITNSALNAGKKIISSLTLDPIMDGFREYETKMNAIQTIMTNTSSKGTTLDDINKALANLNEYSDKTIYNFAQMTDNIGKATAASVGLEDAVIFVKGLANVAAGFGVDDTAIAGATQQMTQALASGTIRLQDWMSMENRGMGGQMLQEALYKTAEEMGVYVDKSVPFRETLQQNWLSSDIFIKTMEKMANDESLINAATKVKTFTQLLDTMKESVGSGWAVTWETIIGDKDEATELFTSISEGFGKVMGSMADYRNESLKVWKEQGGRQAVLNGLKNIIESIGNVLGPVYEAFKKIIDPWNADRLISISKGFEKITEKLKITDKTAGLIKRTFEGVFSVFKLVGLIIKPIGSLFSGLAGSGGSLIDVFFSMTATLGDWIAKAVEFIESSGAIETAMSLMSKAGESVAYIISNVSEKGTEWFAKGVGLLETYVGKFSGVLKDLVVNASDKVDAIKTFVKEFNDAYKPLDTAKNFVVGVFKAIQNGLADFTNFVKTSVDNIRSFFDSIVNKVKDTNIQAIDFVNAGLFASLLVVVKKLIPLLKNFFTATGDFKDSAIGVLEELQGTLETYQKNLKADILQKIAISIGILAASIWALSKVDPDRLLPAVTALGASVVIITSAMWAFNKIDPKEFSKSASTITLLIGISISLNILASALNKLTDLKWDDILRGVVGLGAACVALLAVVKIIDGANINPSQGTGLLLISGSLYVLAGSMAILGNLKVDTILKSLTTLAAVFAGLSLFLNSTKGIQNSVKIAASLIPLTTSLLILAGVLAIFGNMNIDTLKQGFLVLAVALTELSLFTNSMKGFNGNMTSIGAGLLLLSGALLLLTGVLQILGKMDLKVLGQGLVTMATSLGILAVTLNLMPKNTIGIATGLLILSGAMLVLSGAMKSFGEMSWESICKSLLMMVGIMVSFAGASILLAPAIPIMTSMALGLSALGLAAGLVGGALMLLSVGITMLSGSVVGAGISITAALMSLATVIPVMAAAIALGLVSFITILGYNAAAIERALTQLLTALINVVIANIPLFIEAVTTFISEVIVALETLTPQLVEAVFNVLVSILTTLNENLPTIVNLVNDTLLNLILMVLNNLAASIPQIASAITDVIVAIINAISTNVPRVVNAIFDLVINIVNGLSNAVSEKMPQVRQAMKGLVKAIIDELKACIKDAVTVGGDIMTGLKNGITNGLSKVKEAAKNVAKSALDAAKNLLGINSPSRAFMEVGRWSDEGMAKGLTKYSGLVEDAASDTAEGALSGMQKALSAVDSLVSDNMNSSPVIRPVLDLSEIQNGRSTMDGIMSGGYSMNTTMNAARQVSSGLLSRMSILDGNKPKEEANPTNSSNTIMNTFNITGDNPRAIAEEVSKIIQKQVERKSAVWA